MLTQTREQWLTKAANIITAERMGAVPPFRVSLTSPATHTPTSRVLGECWNAKASADNHFELFITAALGAADSVEILAVLVHELAHAEDLNTNGHKGRFITICKAAGLNAGLTGKRTAAGNPAASWTCTTAGAELTAYLEGIVSADALGPIPHAALSPEFSGKTKQKNRQLKVACDACDFTVRMSQTNIDRMRAQPECLSCDTGYMTAAD
mgnify:FL=1